MRVLADKIASVALSCRLAPEVRLTEDIPYGLAAWNRVGAQYKVETPLMAALVELGSAIMGFDAWKAGRGVEELGLADMDTEALGAFLRSGR